MRVAYFVQSHRDPAQVARLVGTLRRGSPEAHLMVGHDRRHSTLTPDDLPPGVDLFFPPPPIERGELSLLSPYFQALERLAEQRVEFDWLVYLSGQDYPTQPLALSEAFLAAAEVDGFLAHWEAFAPVNPWGRRRQGRLRYAYQYRKLAPRWTRLVRFLRPLNRVQSFFHLHTTYGPRLGVRARSTPFGAPRTCYAGIQWTTLRRSAVDSLRASLRTEGNLLAYYARCICPDESLVQTLLLNTAGLRFANQSLRFVDSSGSRDGRPRTLGCADLPALADPRVHFARKLDAAADPELLARLDERLAAAG